jgi:hypothetical protein
VTGAGELEQANRDIAADPSIGNRIKVIWAGSFGMQYGGALYETRHGLRFNGSYCYMMPSREKIHWWAKELNLHGEQASYYGLSADDTAQLVEIVQAGRGNFRVRGSGGYSPKRICMRNGRLIMGCASIGKGAVATIKHAVRDFVIANTRGFVYEDV